MFSDDNRGWLHQAKIMGPKNLGSRTDQAVIYLQIERTLPRVLQARGYNVLNPALLTQLY